MADRLNPAEFAQLSTHWDEKVRNLIAERLSSNYHRDKLEHFSPDEARTLTALLDRLIPQHEGIDLIGFLDAALGIPLGRGDRAPGQPDEATLFAEGLRDLEKASQQLHGESFAALTLEEQERLIADSFTAGPFLATLYRKALHGYFAHPRAWMRIGFMGPSYPEGYTWLKASEVARRHARAEGWDIL